jgi:RNA polymerase sigma factor (sigma-70 family)
MNTPVVTEAESNLSQQDDRELIAQCLGGNQSAWEALITRYQRLIYSIPIRARLSPDDAADIFQAVCLKLYEKLSSLRDHERVSSWLITTTNREVWRMAARNRRDNQSAVTNDEDEKDALREIADAGPLADEQRIALERQQAVREAVAASSDRCRELLTMLFYQKDELSYSDIARRIKMPVPSVGPTRARCLEKLKKHLQGKI